MRGTPKDDQKIMQAIEAQNCGNHRRAASLFREAGNQIRNPSEKDKLWAAAKRCERIHYSD